jgi:cytochrome c peroxidase
MAHRWLAGSVLALLGSAAGQEPTRSDELAALGARLFFDPRLSSDRSIACASCHRPELGFADSRRFSRGVAGRTTPRNAPSIVNRALGTSFLWDGRAATLEEQALMPLENPLEMDLAPAVAVERLRADATYVRDFERALGREPSVDGLARALAAFVRGQVLGDSPVDRFRSGDFAALDDAARAGLWLYESRGGCWRCHGGANFSDEGFHNTGVGAREGVPEPGRAAVTGDPADEGRFKTPTLRGAARTPPYMHDGSLASLEEVVEFYRRGGRANANLDPELAPLDLDAEDARNLVAFLRALSVEGGVAPAAPR